MFVLCNSVNSVTARQFSDYQKFVFLNIALLLMLICIKCNTLDAGKKTAVRQKVTVKHCNLPKITTFKKYNPTFLFILLLIHMGLVYVYWYFAATFIQNEVTS